MLRIRTESEIETRRVGRLLGARLRPGDCVALDGPLGAGKTCFVRGLAEGMGIDPGDVSSPTFVLHHEYEPTGNADTTAAPPPPATPLAHIDAYRLRSSHELETIGWDELIESRAAVLAVEWASRIEDQLPEAHIAISLAHVDAQTREIVIAAPGALTDRLEDLTSLTLATGTCPTCEKPVRSGVETFPFCSERCRLV